MNRKISDYKAMDLIGHYIMIEEVPQYLDICRDSFPVEPDDNALFTYCYVDHDAGITFEVLCTACRMPNRMIRLGEPSPDASFKIRYDEKLHSISVMEYDVNFFKYYNRVKVIEENYNNDDEIREIRKFSLLDDFRSPQYPDDILVMLWAPGVRPEKIWVRTEQIIDDKVAGILLNEPFSSEFGLHEGDLVKIIPIPHNGEFILVVETPDVLSNL